MRFLAPLLLTLASCSTLLQPGEQPIRGPADSVLVFGSLRMDSLLLEEPLERALMIQLDPASPGSEKELSIRGNMFFTDPLPVGSHWRITSLSFGRDDLSVCLDFCLDQPGLLFLGSLQVTSLAAAVRLLPVPSERELLQDLLDAWKGTAWERLIVERMLRL